MDAADSLSAATQTAPPSPRRRTVAGEGVSEAGAAGTGKSTAASVVEEDLGKGGNVRVCG